MLFFYCRHVDSKKDVSEVSTAATDTDTSCEHTSLSHINPDTVSTHCTLPLFSSAGFTGLIWREAKEAWRVGPTHYTAGNGDSLRSRPLRGATANSHFARTQSAPETSQRGQRGRASTAAPWTVSAQGAQFFHANRFGVFLRVSSLSLIFATMRCIEVKVYIRTHHMYSR